MTFGGAYAVLPYVAQQALFHYGWLQPGQMMDGLGLAETTPGPLIMVLQFVGFMGGWNHPGGLAADRRRDRRRTHHHVDDIRPLLPLDFSRRALHRAAARQRAA